ncbi:hypothetical protein PMI33_00292 [Pseudomonas sp. GM67]|jgi:hypothetical protein|nr:hypothetical protein PMI33_00292 [Pseudomonas sp. GM67]
MRFVMIVKTSPDSEAGLMPNEGLLIARGYKACLSSSFSTKSSTSDTNNVIF